MIGAIKRVCRNIHWAVFNHPPRGLTSMTKEELKTSVCEFCKSNDGHMTRYVKTGMVLCNVCFTKAMRKLLKEGS